MITFTSAQAAEGLLAVVTALSRRPGAQMPSVDVQLKTMRLLSSEPHGKYVLSDNAWAFWVTGQPAWKGATTTPHHRVTVALNDNGTVNDAVCSCTAAYHGKLCAHQLCVLIHLHLQGNRLET